MASERAKELQAKQKAEAQAAKLAGRARQIAARQARSARKVLALRQIPARFSDAKTALKAPEAQGC